MADQEHLKILQRGVKAWDAWRLENPDIRPDLARASLRQADLHGADLSRANLREANLSGAELCFAKLQGANLYRADLCRANLRHADLRGADLSAAGLVGSALDEAKISGADFSVAFLLETSLTKVDLTEADYLDSCEHFGRSIIDFHTFENSKNVPIEFWRGCGLPDWLIQTAKLYQEGLTQEDIISIAYEIARIRGEQPIQLFSAFISYSHRDESFARCLYNNLQDKGVRCWFAPEDIKIGDRIRRRIDEMIHLNDKLLLILSENSITSNWVEKEVETAFEKERETGQIVLFPIKLDDTVDKTKAGWVADIRRSRHIGDFTNWENRNAFEASFARVLRDLRTTPSS